MSEFKIWEADTELHSHAQTNGYVCVCRSPRICWGEYKISINDRRYLSHVCSGLESEEPSRLMATLATILIDRIAEGEQMPIVDSKLIDRAKDKSQPLPVATRARRLLRFMTNSDLHVHESINFTSDEPSIEAALGVSESTSKKELEFFLSYLTESGLIRDTTKIDGGFVPTIQGHESVAKELVVENSNRVFVAMWFTREMDDLWIAIENAITRAGYQPIRIDLENFEGLIDDKIATEIRAAKFVVADLTHGDNGHRGSVYYEAGFARGLNKEVIQTVREDHLDDSVPERGIAFDLNHYPVISWSQENLDQLKSDLLNRILARYGRGSLRTDS